MQGKVRGDYSGYKHHFDCVQYGAYSDNFQDDDEIIITEKIHGSQINYILNLETGEEIISSKGLLSRDLVIEKDDTNFYWKAAINSQLKEQAEILGNQCKEKVTSIQLNGEVIPCQKGYSYGATEPKVLLFSASTVADGKESHTAVLNIKKEFSVPVIVTGKYGELKHTIRSLAEGMEQVSGKELHIREGVVVRALTDKKSKKGTFLRLKIINPKYKESGEELS